jgi:hypothetical protein
MRFRPLKRKWRVEPVVILRATRNPGNLGPTCPGPVQPSHAKVRLALVAVNQILPYGRVIRSRMKPAADELTGVLSWTCKRVGVF